MPANRPPDRAPYGSHLPKQFDRTSSKQNMLNYADPHWQGPKGPDAGPAASPAKKPKKPKDPNLNPNMAVPFGRR
jgi:hypothetical protein